MPLEEVKEERKKGNVRRNEDGTEEGGARGAEYGWLRYLFVGWAILETMLFGGLIYGWASLVFVLKEDGLYGDLCTPALSDYGNVTNVTTVQPEDAVSACPGQDSWLNLWFTISMATMNVFKIGIGVLLYKFGLKSARISGWVSFTVGALMMAFADDSIPWMVLPALMTLAYGGVTLQVTNVQVSCLFPRAASVVITLVCGAVDFSSTTQLAVKVLYESGVSSRMVSFLVLCGLHAVIVLLSSLCFMPKVVRSRQPHDDSITIAADASTIQLNAQQNCGEVYVDASHLNDCNCKSNTQTADQLGVNGGLEHGADDEKADDGGTNTSEQPADETGRPEQQPLLLVKGTKQQMVKPEVTVAEDDGKEKEKKAEIEGYPQQELYPDLKSCVKSSVFWLHVMWQGLNMLRLICLFGSINTKLTGMFHGDKDKVSFFTNIQAYCMFGILAVCWISGAVHDWQFTVFKDRSCLFTRTVLPGALPLAMTSLAGVVLSVMWLIDSEAMLYFLFVLLVFYNAFLFGICYSFVIRVFPERYYGILCGLLFTVTGIFSLTQYGVFLWHAAYEGAALHADVFLLVLVVISFAHPAYIVIKSTCCNVTTKRRAPASC